MNRAEISIYAADGNHLRTVLVTKECEREEELMNTDSVTLQWNDTDPTEIPAGAVTHVDGEEFILLDPYRPEQKDEASYTFKPVFQSRVMAWGKVPLMFYTYNTASEIVSREPDWNLTDSAQNFIDYIARVITEETGEKWTAVAAADLQGVQTVQFSSTDVLSALSMVASAFETEWRADKLTNTLYLGKAMFEGDSIPQLTVGENVGVPSVTSNSEGYYNRFLVFGSTRNITQDYEGANVNNIVNKRLTLDPGKYPLGYIDRRKNHEPVFSKILVFDEVYPKSNLVVLEARPRLMYVTDEQTGGFKQIGTDKDGKPIYDQYSIWYVQLGTVDDNGNVTPFRLANTDTYGKDNPDGVLIQGKTLSVHFSSGALTGREFELAYHPKAETENNSDGTPFAVKDGDFEIVYTKDDTFIVPSMTGVVPADGDKAILFNLRMPDEYIQGAYLQLEEAAMDAIAEYESDRDNYEVESNPVAFHDNEELLGLRVGQHVRLINGDRTLDTRIISITRKIDYPFEQTIKVGNDMIKGTTQTLKEDVANANKDINLILAFNNLTQNTINSYNRAINTMLDGFARIGRMWQFDENGDIYTEFNAYSLKNMAALGMTEEPDQGGGGGLDVEELAQYLAEKGYATQEWVNSRGFLTSQSLADYLTRSEAAGLYQPKGNYVTYGRQSLATTNGTNLMPQFINIENENLIAGYKNYWNVINLGSYSGGNFRSQIAMPYQEDIADSDIFIRTANGTRWRTWRRLLHDGNYASVLASVYLRKAGDTMTGSLYFTNANSQIYGNDKDGLILRYGSHFLRLASGGLTHNGQYQIWDSGNDGAGSGLDADLLDGHHASDFNPLRHVGTNTDAHNAYVVLCQAYNDEGGNGINGGMFNGTVYIERGGFLATVKKTAVMIQCGGQYLNNVANYQILSDFSGGVTGLYKIIYNGKAYIALGSSLWNGSRFYATGMWTEQPFVINDDDAGITSSTLLNGTPQIESNAKSATRLLNARTLWGQGFDGSGNVSGDMTGVGSITASGEAIIANQVHINKYGIGFNRNVTNGGIFNTSENGGQLNFSVTYNGLEFGTRVGNSYNPRMLIEANTGNVGIGTTAPMEKLHTVGNMRLDGSLFFRLTGAYIECPATIVNQLHFAWRTNGVWETTPFVFNKSGNMLATGEVQSSGVNAFRSTYGSYGFIIRNDGLNVHFMLTNSGNASGGYNDLRPLYISCASGDVYMGNSALIARHVTGDVEVRRNLVAMGNIACLGAVTEASELEDIFRRLARLENEVF